MVSSGQTDVLEQLKGGRGGWFVVLLCPGAGSRPQESGPLGSACGPAGESN